MEITTYARFVAALVFVLALLAGLSWMARRFRLFGGGTPTSRGPRRLSVVESVAVDAKRRLVMVRRDGTEHLLLLGPAGDVVIERAIGTSAPQAPAGREA